MANQDPFHLQRFVDAQAATYTQARAELAEGEKRSHWMWFIFPQIEGLGSSSMAQRYAVTGLAEAKAYLCPPGAWATPARKHCAGECGERTNARSDLRLSR